MKKVLPLYPCSSHVANEIKQKNDTYERVDELQGDTHGIT
jgi:hypothetical protein